MTVVAWDGKTLASDRQFTRGEIIGVCTKIRRLASGALAVTTGDRDRGEVLMKWFEDGADPGRWPAFQGGDGWVNLIVSEHGKVVEYQQEPMPIPCECPFMAWGSGAMFALGAMGAGADARKAVLVASDLCASCGMGVDAFDVP